MYEVNTIPNEKSLNVSKVVVKVNGVQESPLGLQFSVAGFGKYTDAQGVTTWGPNPLVSTLLNVVGDTWTNWVPGAAASDADYIIDLALKQLGLQRAPVEEAPAEEAPAPKKKAAKKKAAPKVEDAPADETSE
jgi:hypothetical protein